MAEYKPKKVDHSVNRSSDNELKDFFILIAASVVGVIFVGFVALQFSSVAVSFISLKDEQSLVGKLDLLPDSMNKLPTKTSKELTDFANSLWQPFNDELVFVDVQTFNFDKENAFISLGGNIKVTTEYLDNVASENDLAFVLCHELGHFYHRHVLKQVVNRAATIHFGWQNYTA